MRRLVLLAVASWVLLPVSAAGAEPPAVSLDRASPVAAYGGAAAWSEYERRSDSFWLVAASAGGAPARVRVAPRRAPFDVSLGPAAGGSGIVATYSRCRVEPRLIAREKLPIVLPDWKTAEGCDLYQVVLGGGGERRLSGLSTPDESEYLPAGWGSRVAFVRREGRRASRPKIMVGTARGEPRVRRIPGGNRGSGFTEVVALSFDGQRVGFVWAWEKQPISSFDGTPSGPPVPFTDAWLASGPRFANRALLAQEVQEARADGATILWITLSNGTPVLATRYVTPSPRAQPGQTATGLMRFGPERSYMAGLPQSLRSFALEGDRLIYSTAPWVTENEVDRCQPYYEIRLNQWFACGIYETPARFEAFP